jgi:hypothetical protein
MTDELVVLRLGLLGILLLFLFVTAMTMRGALRPTAFRPVERRRAERAARLVIIVPGASGMRPGDAIPLFGEMTIGRDDTNGIVIADSSISSEHATVRSTSRGWRVTDLGSTNGTFVNGDKVDGRGLALRSGDSVELGSVVVRFEW